MMDVEEVNINERISATTGTPATDRTDPHH
jgi:hypothetical protein